MIIKKLPMIGKLWDMSIYAQFCHTVATLLQAGVASSTGTCGYGRSYRQPAHREKDPSGRRKTPGRRITWDVDERRWNISADFERSLCHRRGTLWRAGVHAWLLWVNILIPEERNCSEETGCGTRTGSDGGAGYRNWIYCDLHVSSVVVYVWTDVGGNQL